MGNVSRQQKKVQGVQELLAQMVIVGNIVDKTYTSFRFVV